jgi:hypothetical protein
MTFQLYKWRNSLCTLLVLIQTKTSTWELLRFSKLAGKLHHIKEHQIPGGFKTHRWEPIGLNQRQSSLGHGRRLIVILVSMYTLYWKCVVRVRGGYTYLDLNSKYRNFNQVSLIRSSVDFFSTNDLGHSVFWLIRFDWCLYQTRSINCYIIQQLLFGIGGRIL